MAPTKQWKPVRIRSEEERGSGGNTSYVSLKQGENFVGYPLFTGDPASEEPGYYEYLEHWHNESRRRIPCPGAEVCPLCEEGDRPSTRAKAVFLVTRDEKKNDVSGGDLGGEIKVMSLNWNMIKAFTELRAEGDKIKGVEFRVSLLDDRGNYQLMAKSGKLSAAQIKAIEKSKDFPELEEMVTNQLRKAMEGFAVARALDSDDEPDEPAAESATNGKSKAKPATSKAKEKAEWPEEADDLEVTVATQHGNNTIDVESDEYEGETLVFGTTGDDGVDLTDLPEGAAITISWITDSDNDKVATAVEVSEQKGGEGDAADEPEVDLPDSIEGEQFEVAGEVDEDNYSVRVKNDDLEFDLYVLESVTIDWDDYTVGTKIVVNAKKDSVGDLISTEAPEIVKEKAAKKAAAKKGAKKSA